MNFYCRERLYKRQMGKMVSAGKAGCGGGGKVLRKGQQQGTLASYSNFRSTTEAICCVSYPFGSPSLQS